MRSSGARATCHQQQQKPAVLALAPPRTAAPPPTATATAAGSCVRAMPPPGGGGGGSSGRRFGGLKDLLAGGTGAGETLRQRLSALGSGLGGRSGRQALQDDAPLVTLQVGRTVWEGAPRHMRTELWLSSLQRKGCGVAAAAAYEDLLLKPPAAEAAGDIEKDLTRTFPSHRRFASAEGQDALRRVLLAYAAHDPEVGYCQGLNFVAGLLLQFLPERHAFGGLVVMMSDRGLRAYYSTDMSLLQTHLWQLGRLMPPRLCAHLERLGVLPLLYGAPWLMTCFSADFPASFSARVMDVIMSDKMDHALLKAAVGLLSHVESRLLALSDMEAALALLKLQLPLLGEAVLHDVLTDAFGQPWSASQLALLGSTEGAESVGEAVERVRAANLAAEAAATAAGAAAAEAVPGAAEAAAGGELGSSGEGAAAAATQPLLLRPPPSFRRTSRPSSDGGRVSAGDDAAAPASAHAGAAAGAAGAAAAAAASVSGAGSSRDDGLLIDLSSPTAAKAEVTAASTADGWDPFGLCPAPEAAQQQQQQQQQHAGDPSGGGSSSGHCGPPPPPHQQQATTAAAELLRQQLDELSCGHVSSLQQQQHQQQRQQHQQQHQALPQHHRQPPHHQHQHHQHHQQQHHRHQPYAQQPARHLQRNAASMAHALAGQAEADDWGEFVASPTAAGQQQHRASH